MENGFGREGNNNTHASPELVKFSGFEA